MTLWRFAGVAVILVQAVSAVASDIRGTFAAKVVWKSKTPPTFEQKMQIQQIEKQIKLVLYPDGRYVLADNKLLNKGTWHVANGYFTLAPASNGERVPVVAYVQSRKGTVLTPKLKDGPSYITFVKKSNSTKL